MTLSHTLAPTQKDQIVKASSIIISILAGSLGFSIAAPQSNFDQELERAIKESPPGDHGSPPQISSKKSVLITDDSNANPVDPLLSAEIRISELTLDQSTPIEAFGLLQQRIPSDYTITFTLSLLQEKRHLQEESSLSMVDIPAVEALNYICQLFDLKYTVSGGIILVTLPDTAEQGAAVNP